MSQVIKIKRGGISGISGASTVKGELIIATGSLGNNASGPFLLAHGDSLGLVAGAVFTGSSVPTITDSELNGILFYDSANSRFMRLDSAGNQALNIAATGFTGDTDDVSEGSTNLYYTDARVKTKLTAEAVVSGSATNVRTFLNVADGATNYGDTNVKTKLTAEAVVSGSATNVRTFLNVEDGADVTDATNVAANLPSGTVSGSSQISLSGFNTSQLSENTNLYYTDARVKTKLNTENVISSSAQVSIAASQVTEISNLTAGEGAQLENINSVTISNTQWGYLGGQDQALATTSDVTFASASLANLTVTGNASIQGTLTTVNSNDVNIGDRIITLNTADGAGDAGIHVHDTNGAQTGSLLWDTDGNYWKVGVVGSTDYRLVEWDGETAGAGDFIVTNADGRIDALNTSTAGDLLQSDGDGTFTVSNTIDGGSY